MSKPVIENFENIEITINTINIDKLEELQPHGEVNIPSSSVYPQITLITVPEFKELAGTVKIIFRDITSASKQALLTEGQYAVKTSSEDDVTESFLSLVKFIFNYTNHHVSENKITDDEGNLFNMPHCTYSKKDFENIIIE